MIIPHFERDGILTSPLCNCIRLVLTEVYLEYIFCQSGREQIEIQKRYYTQLSRVSNFWKASCRSIHHFHMHSTADLNSTNGLIRGGNSSIHQTFNCAITHLQDNQLQEKKRRERENHKEKNIPFMPRTHQGFRYAVSLESWM